MLTMITFDTDLSLEEITTLDPLALCTPRWGSVAALPTLSTTTSGIMHWQWKVDKEVDLNCCLIEIGDDAKVFPLRGGHVRAYPKDVLDIYCRLGAFR